jgi:hypothetical protein
MPIVRRVPRRFAKPPDVGSYTLADYKNFASKQAAERLVNEYGAEAMEVQMAL